MKKLVIYYSRTGITRKVADAIGREMKCEIAEITENKNRLGILGYIACGREALKKICPRINRFSIDPNNYDMIVIGTPVWAGKMASPVRTFITANKSKIKQVSFFSTQGSKNDQGVFKDMFETLDKEPKATLMLPTKEVRKNLFGKKLRNFTEKIK